MGGLEEAVAILRIAVSQSNSAPSARFGLGDHGRVHAVEDGGVLEWFVLAFGDREHDEAWVFADIDADSVDRGRLSRSGSRAESQWYCQPAQSARHDFADAGDGLLGGLGECFPSRRSGGFPAPGWA